MSQYYFVLQSLQNVCPSTTLYYKALQNLYKVLPKILYYKICTKHFLIPVVPHKAVAEVSKIGNLWERLVVVNQGWQSEATDRLKGA